MGDINFYTYQNFGDKFLLNRQYARANIFMERKMLNKTKTKLDCFFTNPLFSYLKELCKVPSTFTVQCFVAVASVLVLTCLAEGNSRLSWPGKKKNVSGP